MKIASCLLALTCCPLLSAEEAGWKPLFNGQDLQGWINANGAPETWSVKDGAITCTGFPVAALRTEKQYENFELELEWRHLKPGGNAGIFVWASATPALGQPFLRAVEVQVLDHGYDAKGKNEWYTTHGDVFPIHGTTMTPMRPQTHQGDKSRCFPSEERSRPSPEWNHYRIVAKDGSLRLSVNGKEVSGGDHCVWRKGYLGLESEGSPTEWRNLRIRELPAGRAGEKDSAPVDPGWLPLYNGVDRRGWKFLSGSESSWKPEDYVWAITPANLDEICEAQTTDQWTNATWRIDWRRTTDESALNSEIFLGDSTAGLPLSGSAARPAGEWNQYLITRQGETITVTLNGQPVEHSVVVSGPAPLRLRVMSGRVDLANLLVKPAP